MEQSLLKKFFLSFILVFSLSTLQAQELALIANEPVDAQEFMWVYNKNNFEKKKPALPELEAYLNLYINFRLKVVEAKSLGFDLDTNYRNEIAGYEKALKEQGKPAENSMEFRYITNEYRDGVLMFNISEQKVWNKAQADETLLKTFYQDNQQKYSDKNYDDVRGQVISDYQEKLEQEWLLELHNKYKVKINKSVLKKLVKQ